jgi:hypothetical protein
MLITVGTEDSVMTTSSIAKTGFRLMAGGSVALLVAASGGAAFAQGGNCWHGRCIDSGGGPFGTGPVHGSGSSHNPIVHHPAHGPGSSLKPVATSGPVVRDHRTPLLRPPVQWQPL